MRRSLSSWVADTALRSNGWDFRRSDELCQAQDGGARPPSDQSRSAFRLIAAPHVHVIQTRVALDAVVQTTAVLVLLQEGLECVEERHAASVEHALLDHLVGPQQQRLGNSETERLRRLQVDHQLELGGLLDGEVGGLGAFEDSVDIPDATLP